MLSTLLSTNDDLECAPANARNCLRQGTPLSFSGSARSVAAMVWATLHRLIVALTVLAFVGGMTLQLMPPKPAMAANDAAPASSDCAHMAMPSHDGGSGHGIPCKGMDPECVKQMQCLGTPSLPLRLDAHFVPFAYGSVDYWALAKFQDGRSIKPDLFPPIRL
jgi:hypothetical protein